MLIIHKIDEFLFTIFPNVNKGDEHSLLNTMKEFYTQGLTSLKYQLKTIG